MYWNGIIVAARGASSIDYSLIRYKLLIAVIKLTICIIIIANGKFSGTRIVCRQGPHFPQLVPGGD